MAEVTEMTNLNGAPPLINGAEPPKRPRGRPRKVDKPVEPEESETDSETQFIGNADIWTTLLNFTPEDWNCHIVYLDRVAPRTDRKANGKPVHIQQYSTGFTREDVMKEHGSGAYQLHLNVIDQASGKSHRIAREIFTIINPKYPPVVPPGDWIEDKANENWKWGTSAVTSTTNGPSYPPGFNIADMMDKADQRAMRMVEIMTPKENGNTDAVLARMVEMNSPERLIALMQALAPKPDGSLALIIELLRSDLKESRDKISKMEERILNAPQPKSIIEQFIELKPAIAELIPLFGGKAGKTDPWATIAEKALDSLPQALELGRDFFTKQNQPAPQPNKPAAIAAAATTTAAPDNTKPIDQMSEDEKRKYVDALWNKWGGHLLNISSKLVEDFKVQDQGYSFRDWYVEMYGKLRWADLKRDIAPDLMTSMYFAHQQLRTELAPPERLVAFLNQFYTDFGQEVGVTVEDEIEGDDPEQPEADQKGNR